MNLPGKPGLCLFSPILRTWVDVFDDAEVIIWNDWDLATTACSDETKDMLLRLLTVVSPISSIEVTIEQLH